MKTLYNLTKKDCKTLCSTFDYDTNTIALALWDKGKASSLESGVKKAIKIKNFAKN